MKEILIPVFTFLYSFSAFSQLEEGFRKEEARDMIALCNSFTFLKLFNSDDEILPLVYKKRYTSSVLGMDNLYQVYQKGDVAIINFRGSTAEKISWLENIYSSMIPAEGKIEISGKKFKYCFAEDKAATVHAGYALATAFLYQDL